MIKFKNILSEAKKYKPNQKISKQEWGKIAKFNKHIGKDGKHYVTQLTSKGTTLVPVIVEGIEKSYKVIMELEKDIQKLEQIFKREKSSMTKDRASSMEKSIKNLYQCWNNLYADTQER